MPVAMTMCMTSAAAAASTSVRMTVVPTRRSHADQVDREPDRADREKLVRTDLGRVDQALNSFKDDKDRDEAEEDGVGKAGQGLHACVAIGETGRVQYDGDQRLETQVDLSSPVSVDVIARPGRHDAGKETDPEREAVEEHVYG